MRGDHAVVDSPNLAKLDGVIVRSGQRNLYEVDPLAGEPRRQAEVEGAGIVGKVLCARHRDESAAAQLVKDFGGDRLAFGGVHRLGSFWFLAATHSVASCLHITNRQ